MVVIRVHVRVLQTDGHGLGLFARVAVHDSAVQRVARRNELDELVDGLGPLGHDGELEVRPVEALAEADGVGAEVKVFDNFLFDDVCF